MIIVIIILLMIMIITIILLMMINMTIIIFVVMLLLTFPFALWPAATILGRLRGPNADDSENTTFAARATRVLTNFYVVRVGLCVFITVLAMYFTDFGTFLALIGYPCWGLQGMLLPAAMYLTMDRRTRGGRLSAGERSAEGGGVGGMLVARE